MAALKVNPTIESGKSRLSPSGSFLCVANIGTSLSSIWCNFHISLVQTNPPTLLSPAPCGPSHRIFAVFLEPKQIFRVTPVCWKPLFLLLMLPTGALMEHPSSHPRVARKPRPDPRRMNTLGWNPKKHINPQDHCVSARGISILHNIAHWFVWL